MSYNCERRWVESLLLTRKNKYNKVKTCWREVNSFLRRNNEGSIIHSYYVPTLLHCAQRKDSLCVLQGVAKAQAETGISHQRNRWAVDVIGAHTSGVSSGNKHDYKTRFPYWYELLPGHYTQRCQWTQAYFQIPPRCWRLWCYALKADRNRFKCSICVCICVIRVQSCLFRWMTCTIVSVFCVIVVV